MNTRRSGDPDAARANSEAVQDLSRTAVVSAQDLFGGRREIVISHDGHLYRLKITRLGKLILTK